MNPASTGRTHAAHTHSVFHGTEAFRTARKWYGVTSIFRIIQDVLADYTTQSGRFHSTVAGAFWAEHDDESVVDSNPITWFTEMNVPSEFIEFASRLVNQATSSSWSEWAVLPRWP